MKCNQCGTEFQGKFCPECGAKTEAVTYAVQQSNSNNGKSMKKKKKPIFLRWWFILAVIILIIAAITTFGGDKPEKFQWAEVEMHELLPTPESDYGDIGHNSKTNLILTVCKTDEAAFKAYRDKCIEFGYTIEPEETYLSYSAFNAEGYSVRIVFSEAREEMNLYLDAPEEFGKFQWPAMGLGAMLPKTKSDVGDITWDNSNTFIVHVGNTAIEEFNEYVNACIELGYTTDHSRDEDYYSAENAEGYKLTLMYIGFNEIEISLKAPDKAESTPSEKEPEDAPEDTPEDTPEDNTHSTAGLSPEFKEAMDSYENFMNEYVDFMKKYMANPTDLGLIADYTSYMSKYTDVMKSFEEWEGESMNTAEAAYYMDLQMKINKKLLEIAQ